MRKRAMPSVKKKMRWKRTGEGGSLFFDSNFLLSESNDGYRKKRSEGFAWFLPYWEACGNFDESWEIRK